MNALVIIPEFNSDKAATTRMWRNGKFKVCDVDFSKMFCKPDAASMTLFDNCIFPFNRLFGWLSVTKPNADDSFDIIQRMNAEKLFPVIEIYTTTYECLSLVCQRFRFVNAVLLRPLKNSSCCFLEEKKEVLSIAYTRIEASVVNQIEIPMLSQLPVLTKFNFQNYIKEKVVAVQY